MTRFSITKLLLLSAFRRLLGQIAQLIQRGVTNIYPRPLADWKRPIVYTSTTHLTRSIRRTCDQPTSVSARRTGIGLARVWEQHFYKYWRLKYTQGPQTPTFSPNLFVYELLCCVCSTWDHRYISIF